MVGGQYAAEVDKGSEHGYLFFGGYSTGAWCVEAEPRSHASRNGEPGVNGIEAETVRLLE